MPARFPMPAPERVRSTLADLFGRSVEIAKVSPPDPEDAAYVADLLADTGSTGALIVSDPAGVAVLAAALTMMPPAMVESVRTRGTIDEPSIPENFGEVVNVLAQLFNSPDTPHLRWNSVNRADGELEAPVAKLLAEPAARRDFAITVEGYGNGKLSILVA
ncbi:MAG: hypothetical protein ACOYNI_00750 [Acidimicrobiia bacterium]